MTTRQDQTQQAYAEYCRDFNGHLTYTLNAQYDNPSEEYLSKLISKLFYKLECDEYTYRRRELQKTKCRIERIVSIEKKDKNHAHIILRRFGNHAVEEITEKISNAWHDLNRTQINQNNQYLLKSEDNEIRSNEAVCFYNTKDVAKQIRDGIDTIDFKSSFIRKHSNSL